MANIIRRRTKDDPSKQFGEPSGETEKFYLGRSIRGVHLDKPQSVPVGINGWYRYAQMGEDNEMEKEFVDVIEQSASTAYVPDGDERAPRQADQPAKMRVEYLGDYDLRRESKKVHDVRARETIVIPGGIHRRQNRGPKAYTPIEDDVPAAAAPETPVPQTEVSAPDVSGEAQKEG